MTTTTDRSERLMRTLAGCHAFYGAELSEFALDVWLRVLQPYAVDAIERAFDAHVCDPREGRFMPKPAHIIAHLQESTDDRAIAAWTQVLDEARRYGRRVSDWDAVTRAALDSVGGFDALRRAHEDSTVYLQRRFCDAFGAFARREQREQLQLGHKETGDNVRALPDDVVAWIR